MRSKLLKILVLMELILIAFLIHSVYRKLTLNKNFLRIVSENTLPKDKLVSGQALNLNYYQEFKPKEKIIEERDWIKGKVTYTINEDTLNERYDYALKKKENVYRIITLGDSFTFGFLVRTDQNWTEKLEEKLNSAAVCKGKKFEVINLAMPGYGVEYITYRYVSRGKKYNPDLLIWLESGSGFNRVNEAMMPLVNQYENEMPDEDLQISRKAGKYPAWIRALNDFQKLYSDKQISKMVGNSWQKFINEKGDVKVTVATFVNISFEQKELLNSWIGEADGINVYFGVPGLASNKFLLRDGHPNPEGHRMISQNIFEYLVNNYHGFC